LLADIFTTALNDNAARGLLSVNQTNLAAWSAVLSAVTVVSNNIPNSRSPCCIPDIRQSSRAQFSAALQNRQALCGRARHRTDGLIPRATPSAPADGGTALLEHRVGVAK
jgi:hypothetical protein